MRTASSFRLWLPSALVPSESVYTMEGRQATSGYVCWERGELWFLTHSFLQCKEVKIGGCLCVVKMQKSCPWHSRVLEGVCVCGVCVIILPNFRNLGSVPV